MYSINNNLKWFTISRFRCISRLKVGFCIQLVELPEVPTHTPTQTQYTLLKHNTHTFQTHRSQAHSQWTRQGVASGRFLNWCPGYTQGRNSVWHQGKSFSLGERKTNIYTLTGQRCTIIVLPFILHSHTAGAAFTEQLDFLSGTWS